MTDSLKTHEVIPDVIDTVPPAVVKVSYPSGVSVEIGKELTPTQVKDQPTVDWDADNSSFYTLCMTGNAILSQSSTIALVKIYWRPYIIHMTPILRIFQKMVDPIKIKSCKARVGFFN